MAHLIEDVGDLFLKGERVDEDLLALSSHVHEEDLITDGIIDEENLWTDLGFSSGARRFRADTTLLTADETTVTADYHY